MGHRQEPRLELNLPATLCGMDASGRPFLESVTIHNISGNGLLVENKRSVVDTADMVVVRCGQHKSRFKAAWVYTSPTNSHQWLGLQHVHPTTLSWGLDLPVPAPDEYERPRLQTRRRHPRFSCELSVEVRKKKMTTPTWSSTSNIGEGGCFVQMLNVLPISTPVEIGLWVGQCKIWASGIIVSNVTGFGIGIKFTELSAEASYRLRQAIRGSIESLDRRVVADGAPEWQTLNIKEACPSP
jgi:PilZ domain